jgi:hypothetical protein
MLACCKRRRAADDFQLHAVGRGWACALRGSDLELLADLPHQGDYSTAQHVESGHHFHTDLDLL